MLVGEANRIYLGAEAVPQSAELLDAVLLLQGLDGLDDDGVDGLLGVRIVASGALSHPGHEVESAGAVEGDWVTVEDVNDQGKVAVGGELVSHELAVLPDSNDIGNVEQANTLVLLVGGRGCDVGVILPGHLDGVAGRGSPALVLCQQTVPEERVFAAWRRGRGLQRTRG